MKTKDQVLNRLGADSSFEAGGKRYVINMPDAMSIDCHMEFVLRSIEVAAGIELKDQIGAKVRMEKLYNEGKMMDFAYEFKSDMYRLGKVHERKDPIMWACTVFIRPSDDDLRYVPKDAARLRAIEDWNDAGIPFSFFVHWLGIFNPLLKALLNSATPASFPSHEAPPQGEASATSSTSPRSTSRSSASALPKATSPSSKRSKGSLT